jgi:hypothetical protein
VVPAGAAHAVVEVEPLVVHAGANVEVGGKPMAGAGADAGGRWGQEDGTPSNTWAGHCWMKLP